MRAWRAANYYQAPKSGWRPEVPGRGLGRFLAVAIKMEARGGVVLGLVPEAGVAGGLQAGGGRRKSRPTRPCASRELLRIRRWPPATVTLATGLIFE